MILDAEKRICVGEIPLELHIPGSPIPKAWTIYESEWDYDYDNAFDSLNKTAAQLFDEALQEKE